DPAEPGPAQPADYCLQPLRQATDQSLDALLVILRGRLSRRRGTASNSGCLFHRALSGLDFVLRIDAPLVGAVLRARELAGDVGGRSIGSHGPRHRPVQTRIGA